MTATIAPQKCLTTLRTAALIEGLTLLILLFIAVPLKHAAGIPMAVSLMGPIHGIAFIGYMALLYRYHAQVKLDGGQQLRLVIAAFIPFGALYASHLYRQQADRLK